jgi:ethanolamine utilization protein EutQ (cupin superfamily)
MKGMIMGMKHFDKAQSKPITSLGIEGINVYLQDTVSSNNDTAAITGGFFRMEAGNPLEYTYSYDECKIMLEGEMTITESGGETVNLKPGDVIYFDSGTTVTFSSQSSGTAFYVGQRKLGVL